MKIYLPLQVLGTTLVSVSIGLIYMPAGLFAAGAAMTLFGVAYERAKSRAQ